MYRLLLLGGVSLEGPSGPLSGRIVQRQRLALLAVLATSPAGRRSREALVGLFWPERPEEKARHSLANALYGIRRKLGETAVLDSGGQLRLDPDAVWCDVRAFRTALERGEEAEELAESTAALEEAVSLYRGPFLDGFYVSGAPDFERWAEAERRRLADRFGKALEALAERAEARDAWPPAVEWWKRRAAHEPTNSRVAVRLMEALAASGHWAGAVEHARTHEATLRDELGVEPPSDVRAALERFDEAALETAPPTGSILSRRSSPPGGGRSVEAAGGDLFTGLGPSEDSFPPARAPKGSRPGQARPGPRVGTGGAVRWPARWLSRGAIAVTATAVAGAALAPRLLPPQASPPPAVQGAAGEAAVAVFPFSVRGGEDLGYLEEGMVDLLSTALDGAGNLHAVDPHALLGFIGREATGPVPDEAGRIARRFGAEFYVLGSIVAAGDRLQVSATLYDRGGTVVGRARGRIVDDRQVFEVVDTLSRQLLATGIGGPGTRLSRLGALTTESLTALRQYLRGENAFRANRFDSAVVAYGRAVAADSTFALGHYRLAVAGAYATAFVDPSDPIRRAMRHRDRLGDRDRAIVEAHDAFLRGAAGEAERRLRSVVEHYANDVEAWYSLSRLLLWYLPVLVPSTSEMRAAGERVLELDPEHAKAHYELAWVAALEARYGDAQTHLERFLGLAPDGDQAAARRAGLAYGGGDRAEQERTLAGLRQAQDIVVRFAAEDVARAADDLPGAIEVALLLTESSRSPEAWAIGRSLAAHLQLAMGRWEEAMARPEPAEDLDISPWSALTTRAALAASPFLPLDPWELLELRDRVAASDRPSPFARVARPYLAGLLSVRLRDFEAAERYARELDGYAAEPKPGAQSEAWAAMARDWALSVRAHAAQEAGRPERGLELLDQADPEAWWWPVWRETEGGTLMGARAHERYLMAELLRELGRHEEALVWYGSFGWRPFDQIYLAPSHLRRAEIHERLGDLEAAIRHYRRVIEIWDKSDPELGAWVETAREGLARLTEGTPLGG